jgi:hypothetical protein
MTGEPVNIYPVAPLVRTHTEGENKFNILVAYTKTSLQHI